MEQGRVSVNSDLCVCGHIHSIPHRARATLTGCPVPVLPSLTRSTAPAPRGRFSSENWTKRTSTSVQPRAATSRASSFVSLSSPPACRFASRGGLRAAVSSALALTIRPERLRARISSVPRAPLIRTRRAVCWAPDPSLQRFEFVRHVRPVLTYVRTSLSGTTSLESIHAERVRAAPDGLLPRERHRGPSPTGPGGVGPRRMDCRPREPDGLREKKEATHRSLRKA